jgi:hypothetical protein
MQCEDEMLRRESEGIRMKILSVEVLDDEAVTRLRREARRERRERHNYLMSYDPSTLLQMDISEFGSQINIFQDTKSVEAQFPVVANTLIRNYAENDDGALVLFAGEKGKPVLVEFFGEPSKTGVERLRQAAKTLNLEFSFFRLTGGWAIVEARPRQTPEEFNADIMKDLGIR